MEGPPPAPRGLLALASFPRVFAAGAVAADSEADGKSQNLPYFVPESCFSESGWDRLRQLFVKDEQESYSEELINIYRSALSAGVLGWAYGGIPAFIHAKQRYIEQSQAETYHNRFDAVQHAHRAAMRGFLRYGWRWSWRTAAFVTVFKILLFTELYKLDLNLQSSCLGLPECWDYSSVNTGLTVYRNKNALSHFVVAGAVTGSLFRINLGLRGLVAGGIIGALLGTPVGSLWMVLQKYCGETVQETKQKDQQAQRERKLAEWRARLQFTELLPEDIESHLQKNQSQDDAKKIKALLSLPRNPSSPDKQGED